MDDLRTRLIEGQNSGTFLKAVDAIRRRETDEGRIAAELAGLHNSGDVDVLAAFKDLRRDPGNGINFYLTAHAFASALPAMNASVNQVMETIASIVKAGGQDGAVDGMLEGFSNYCAKEESRCSSALQMIEADPHLADLLPAVIFAGAKLNADRYYRETVRLISSDHVNLRRKAAFAVGGLGAPEDASLTSDALTALEAATSSGTDGALLAFAVKSAISLLQNDSTQEPRVKALVDGILTRGDAQSLRAASELLAWTRTKISPAVRDMLVSHLHRVSPNDITTLNIVDMALSRMVGGADRLKAISFVERYLDDNADLKFENLQHLFNAVGSDPKLLGTFLTRWFLHGSTVLRMAITSLVTRFHGRSQTLEIDPDEIPVKDAKHLLFIARKTIGYLFFAPIPMSSILISLMGQTDDDTTLQALSSLLYDPVLTSFPSAADFVSAQAQAVTGKLKTFLENTHREAAEHLDILKKIPNIPALHPTETQREIQHRRLSQSMRDSFREAEKQSPLRSIILKSVLLYGHKSIYHVHGPNNQTRRVETQMKTFGSNFEIPAMEQIDPVGLDFMIRVFMSEGIDP